MDDQVPLCHRTIAITRPLAQSVEMAHKIRLLGGTPLIRPLIHKHVMNQCLWPRDSLHERFVGLLFTSITGVEAFVHMLGGAVGRCARIPAFCVGSATARVAIEAGFAVQGTPALFTAEGIAMCVESRVPPGRLLWVRGNLADEDWIKTLQQAGYVVIDILGYETLPDVEQARLLVQEVIRQEVDAITFASGSAVVAWMDTWVQVSGTQQPPQGVVIAAIGPKTRDVFTNLGWRVHVMADQATGAALVTALEHYYTQLQE